MSQIIHTTQYITTSLCYMISVYLKYSSANVFFFLFKNRQISQLVAYIVSKKEGSIHQSLFSPLSIYVVCSKALAGAWDKHWLGNLLTGSMRRGWGCQFLRGTILMLDSANQTYILIHGNLAALMSHSVAGLIQILQICSFFKPPEVYLKSETYPRLALLIPSLKGCSLQPNPVKKGNTLSSETCNLIHSNSNTKIIY